MQNSIIHKYLDSLIVQTINKELLDNRNNKLWGKHININVGPEYKAYSKEYNDTGPLRHGTTFWLRTVSDGLKFIKDQTKYFPETLTIIKELAKSTDYARCYWHTLAPNDMIDLHIDNLPYFDFISHRYQVYLDIPDESIIIIDNEVQNPAKFRNCILDFNFSLPHYYKNNSDKAFTFAVIDILKLEYKLIGKPDNI